MSAINAFLLKNNLRIATNPCVSPDFCLDWPALAAKLKAGGAGVKTYEKSRFATAVGEFVLLEDIATGDCAWKLAAKYSDVLEGGEGVGDGSTVFPATFANLLKLKNLAQEKIQRARFSRRPATNSARARSGSARVSRRCTGRRRSGR